MTNGNNQQQRHVFHSSFSIRSVLGEDETVSNEWDNESKNKRVSLLQL